MQPPPQATLPPKDPEPISGRFPRARTPAPDPLSAPVNSPVLDVSYKWSHTIRDLCVWLLPPSIVFVRSIRLVASISASFLSVAE